MSYTRYPAEASSFATAASVLKVKVDNNVRNLNESSNILSSCNKGDLIITRSSESITNIMEKVKRMSNAITTDISIVKEIANKLENEAKLRAMKEDKEKEIKELRNTNG